MRFRFLSVLLLMALAPVLAMGGDEPRAAQGDLSASLSQEVKKAIDQHLADSKAPRDATVLEMTPSSESTVRVCVWMPGDDQPTGLPRVVSYSYAIPSGQVMPEE